MDRQFLGVDKVHRFVETTIVKHIYFHMSVFELKGTL